jgi:hypothetical protein
VQQFVLNLQQPVLVTMCSDERQCCDDVKHVVSKHSEFTSVVVC